MEAATLASLAHNAAGPPGRFAVPAPAHWPAQQLGLVSPLEDVAVAHSDIPPALPYTQRLRREGECFRTCAPCQGSCKLESIHVTSVTGPLQRHLCLIGLRKCISLQFEDCGLATFE